MVILDDFGIFRLPDTVNLVARELDCVGLGSLPRLDGSKTVKYVNTGSPFRPSPPAGETRPSMEERQCKTAKYG